MMKTPITLNNIGFRMRRERDKEEFKAMFEWTDESRLLLEENERKPNRYTARALLIGLGCVLIILVINELGLFYVDKTTLRICSALFVALTMFSEVIVRSEKLSVNPQSKYLLLCCVLLMTFLITLELFIFATPLYLLPLLLAVQYNSRRFTRVALIGTCLCVFITPPLGYVLHMWNEPFLRYLLSLARGSVIGILPSGGYRPGTEEIAMLEPINHWKAIAGVTGYISFPWLLITITLSRLTLSATRKGEENIQNQLRIMEMSHMDALTGLYNQNAYKHMLEKDLSQFSVGIVFFDVDELKDTNDDYGHERGDLLLKRCADSLKPLLDDTCRGFRIGGDEFLLIMDTRDPLAVEAKARQWKMSMQAVNDENRTLHDGLHCHMSMGTAFGEGSRIADVISQADERMYAEKQKYHLMHGAGNQVC